LCPDRAADQEQREGECGDTDEGADTGWLPLHVGDLLGVVGRGLATSQTVLAFRTHGCCVSLVSA
jgi:hypothetical protein